MTLHICIFRCASVKADLRGLSLNQLFFFFFYFAAGALLCSTILSDANSANVPPKTSRTCSRGNIWIHVSQLHLTSDSPQQYTQVLSEGKKTHCQTTCLSVASGKKCRYEAKDGVFLEQTPQSDVMRKTWPKKIDR